MKNKLRCALWVMATCLLLNSCQYYYDNDGYPSNVYFSNEGGCKIIYGSNNASISSFEIYERDSICDNKVDSTYLEEGSGKDGLIIRSSDWLTVKHRSYTDSIVLYVKPNTTGKKRKARIDVSNYDYGFFEITVKQDK